MDANQYLPPALPLLNDAELTHLRHDYEAMHARLTKAATPRSTRKKRLLRQAIAAINAELHARGIEGEPWWVTRQSALRPPRRLDHPASPAAPPRPAGYEP